MKQYKPGQFVSIGGKLAKVRRSTSPSITCDCCRIANKDECPCIGKNRKGTDIPYECGTKLGFYFYPKFIKQC